MNLERRDMHIGGSKGRELEIGLFDALRADDPAYRDLFLKYANRNTGKVEFEQSLELVKNFQPADPEKPNRPFASWLLRSTREILGLKDEDAKKAKFYTSVAPSSLPAKVAPLDFWYGIDAFIEIEQEKGGFRRVTLDATGKDKKENPKADIVIYGKDLEDKQMEKAAREVAEKVAATLTMKQKG